MGAAAAPPYGKRVTAHTTVRKHDHAHSHGLVDAGITRSRQGLRAVSLSLAVLGLTALAQTLVSF